MTFRSLICGDPGIGAPLDKWQAWLEELRAMDQDDDAVRVSIEEAEQVIACVNRGPHG